MADHLTDNITISTKRLTTMPHPWTQYHEEGRRAYLDDRDLVLDNPYSREPFKGERNQAIQWAEGWMLAELEEAPPAVQQHLS